jgi:1,4-dihydroxy-2-naphthoate octaprenyltransferase
MITFRKLLRISHPIHLILAALTYTLGAGISHYLGYAINAVVFGLGFLAVLSIQAASSWLMEYFHLPLTPLLAGETPRDREHFRVDLLQASYASLTLGGAIVISLLVAGHLNVPAGFLFGVIVLFLVAYALPPMRLAEMGYGELILAIYLGTLLPALAFLLQSGEFHRLLTFTTFPLSLLALAYFLVGDFPTYAADQKLGHHSLLTRVTWQRAIPVHHILILAAFLFFAIAPFFGFPWGLVWPVFVVLPFAALQIIWLQRISLGGRTLWNFLTNLALATFGLSVYLMAFTFWIR